LAKAPKRPLTLRDGPMASACLGDDREPRAPGPGRRVPRPRARACRRRRRGWLRAQPHRRRPGLVRVNLVAVVIPPWATWSFRGLSGISEGAEGSGAPARGGLQPTTDPSRGEGPLRDAVLAPLRRVRGGARASAPRAAMLERAGVPVVEIMDVDGEAVDAVVGISPCAGGTRDGRGDPARGLPADRRLGTKMPLDFRARKRMEGSGDASPRRGSDRGPGVLRGRLRAPQGREMTEAILAGARSSTSSTTPTT
jgi:LacI family gluconate utilization system Gnt-I transcriptional repressor